MQAMENTCNSPVENGVPITPEHFNDLMMELKKAQKELDMLSETVLGGTARLSVDDEFRIITDIRRRRASLPPSAAKE